MTFIESATELLERTEASLNSLIADALRAKAYGEIAALAELAEQLSGIGAGRTGRKTAAPAELSAAGVGSADAAKGPEPFWMRPKG